MKKTTKDFLKPHLGACFMCDKMYFEKITTVVKFVLKLKC